MLTIKVLENIGSNATLSKIAVKEYENSADIADSKMWCLLMLDESEAISDPETESVESEENMH